MNTRDLLAASALLALAHCSSTNATGSPQMNLPGRDGSAPTSSEAGNDGAPSLEGTPDGAADGAGGSDAGTGADACPGVTPDGGARGTPSVHRA